MKLSEDLIERIHERPELTEVDLETLELVMQGYTNTQIAKELFLSYSAIRSRVRKVYRRFGIQPLHGEGVTKRVKLAHEATRWGFYDIEEAA